MPGKARRPSPEDVLRDVFGSQPVPAEPQTAEAEPGGDPYGTVPMLPVATAEMPGASTDPKISRTVPNRSVGNSAQPGGTPPLATLADATEPSPPDGNGGVPPGKVPSATEPNPAVADRGEPVVTAPDGSQPVPLGRDSSARDVLVPTAFIGRVVSSPRLPERELVPVRLDLPPVLRDGLEDYQRRHRLTRRQVVARLIADLLAADPDHTWPDDAEDWTP